MRIKYFEGICSECGELKLIVQKSLQLCAICNKKRLTKKWAERSKFSKLREKVDTRKLDKFYKEVWDSYGKVQLCYETGCPIFGYHKWHVHHVLDKKDYPELMFNRDVCVLLLLEQHSQWHTIAPSDRKQKMPNTYQKYLELLKKYDRNKYNTESNSGVETY